MTTTEQAVPAPDLGSKFSEAELQQKAKDHLWMHFSRQSVMEDGAGVPIIVKGEGHHIWDSKGKKYFDGLSGLFVVNAGHGRRRLAEVAAKQAEELAFFPIWSYAHPAAIELADRLASYAPGDLNRVFFSTGGGEAVETAFKLAKYYWKLQGRPTKHKVISRAVAYHGTPQGALAITGIPAMKEMFEPVTPGGFRVPNTNYYRAEEMGFSGTPEQFGLWAANRIEEMILFEGADTVAASSSSPCRTAADASRRRPDTSSACARSATSTTCCWSPTRSSRPSDASATSSPRPRTASSPT